MKTKAEIEEQKDMLQKQLEAIYKWVAKPLGNKKEIKSMYTWAQCIESGIKALDWVLADDSTDIVY